MKHLINLFSAFMICSATSHCVAQDETLKYILRNYGDRECPFYVNSPEPYGFEGAEVHFTNKGKKIYCEYYRQDNDKYKQEKYSSYSLVKIDKKENIAIYHTDDLEHKFHMGLIKLSLDRKELFLYGVMPNDVESIIGEPKKYELLDTKFPTWMKYSPNASFKYEQFVLDDYKLKVQFRNNGKILNVTNYVGGYGSDKVISENESYKFVELLSTEDMLMYVKSPTRRGFNFALFISPDRNIIYEGNVTYDSKGYIIENYEMNSSSKYKVFSKDIDNEDLPSWMN